MIRIARGPALWRRVALFVAAGAGLVALGLWVLRTPELNFDDEAQVREWTAYALAGQSDPLQVQRLDRAGDHYAGEALSRTGRTFRLRVEEREGRLDTTADWRGPDEQDRRRSSSGPPPVEVRHPWLRWWWVPLVVLGAGVLYYGLRARRAAKLLQPLRPAGGAPAHRTKDRVTRKRRRRP